MKKLLWKPSSVSWQIHLLIAFIAVIGILLVETLRVEVRQPYYKTKVHASTTMKAGMEVLRDYRIRNIRRINKKIDHLDSGLIGKQSTLITTSTVDIANKLVTLNPNWGAVMVDMLRRSKIKKGDTIAVSLTGSFPAINLAVLSAAKAMDLNCIIITSVASSTWGANMTNFTWLDMEQVLYDRGVVPFKSIAASLGGLKDNALGMSESGRAILKNIIKHHNTKFLEYSNIKENIEGRMALYQEKAGDRPIKAYINVGGGTVSIGTFIGKRRYKPGLNLRPSYKAKRIDSVISRFARMGLPVINMNYMNVIARNYNLPVEFKKIPPVGKGDLYLRQEYNNVLIVAVLSIILIMLYIFIKMGIGYRIFTPRVKDNRGRAPEHMV